MLLSRPQMMLYALKLWGQRGECSKRSHLLFRNHHFLLAGRQHFRFRLGGCPQERARQIPPISPLLSDSEATTGWQQGQSQFARHVAVRARRRLSALAFRLPVAPAPSAGCWQEGRGILFYFSLFGHRPPFCGWRTGRKGKTGRKWCLLIGRKGKEVNCLWHPSGMIVSSSSHYINSVRRILSDFRNFEFFHKRRDVFKILNYTSIWTHWIK